MILFLAVGSHPALGAQTTVTARIARTRAARLVIPAREFRDANSVSVGQRTDGVPAAWAWKSTLFPPLVNPERKCGNGAAGKTTNEHRGTRIFRKHAFLTRRTRRKTAKSKEGKGSFSWGRRHSCLRSRDMRFPEDVRNFRAPTGRRLLSVGQASAASTALRNREQSDAP